MRPIEASADLLLIGGLRANANATRRAPSSMIAIVVGGLEMIDVEQGERQDGPYARSSRNLGKQSKKGIIRPATIASLDRSGGARGLPSQRFCFAYVHLRSAQ